MGKIKKYTLLKAIFRYSLRNFVKLKDELQDNTQNIKK